MKTRATRFDNSSRSFQDRHYSSELWLACGAGLCVLASLWLALALHYEQTGWDFPQFYLAGRMPLHHLYDRAAYLATAREVFAGTRTRYFPPYVRPAVFALPLRLLRWLPIPYAFWVWASVQFGCYLVALGMARRIYTYPPEMLLGWGLFYPAMFGIITGQDTNAILVIIMMAFFAMENGRDRLAGILFSLCTYKFNLFLLIPVYLWAARRRRSFAYMLTGSAGFTIASSLLASPGAYLHYLGRIPEMTMTHDLSSTAGWLGLTAHAPILYAAGVAAIVIVSWLAMRAADQRLGFAIAISGSLLMAYHVAWYDLALLVVPISVALTRRRAWLAVAASFTLLLVVPVWFHYRWLASAALALFVGLVQIALGRQSSRFERAGDGVEPKIPKVPVNRGLCHCQALCKRQLPASAPG